MISLIPFIIEILLFAVVPLLGVIKFPTVLYVRIDYYQSYLQYFSLFVLMFLPFIFKNKGNRIFKVLNIIILFVISIGFLILSMPLSLSIFIVVLYLLIFSFALLFSLKFYYLLKMKQ